MAHCLVLTITKIPRKIRRPTVNVKPGYGLSKLYFFDFLATWTSYSAVSGHGQAYLKTGMPSPNCQLYFFEKTVTSPLLLQQIFNIENTQNHYLWGESGVQNLTKKVCPIVTKIDMRVWQGKRSGLWGFTTHVAIHLSHDLEFQS